MILGRLGPSRCHFDAILACFWAVLGHLGAIWRLSWGVWEPSWGHLGPSRSQPGASWAYLGPLGPQSRKSLKNKLFLNDFGGSRRRPMVIWWSSGGHPVVIRWSSGDYLGFPEPLGRPRARSRQTTSCFPAEATKTVLPLANTEPKVALPDLTRPSPVGPANFTFPQLCAPTEHLFLHY